MTIKSINKMNEIKNNWSIKGLFEKNYSSKKIGDAHASRYCDESSCWLNNK